MGQSEPGNDGNEGILRIPQSSSITGTSPSDCFVSFPGHSFSGVLPFWRSAVNVFYSPSQLSKFILEKNMVESKMHIRHCLMFNLEKGCSKINLVDH